MKYTALKSSVALLVPGILTLVVCVGCQTVSMPPTTIDKAVEPVSFEQLAFDLLSDYYCGAKRWPDSWEQVEQFQRSRGDDTAWMQVATNIQISSPRAIFLTLDYTDNQGQKRRATFIAPPSCGTEPPKELVSIAGEGVVFRLPDDFTLMSLSDIRQRWKKPPYPDAAWITPEDRILAIRFGELEMQEDELSQFAGEIAEAYELSIPSLAWTYKDIKRISGKSVLYHEFQSTTSRGAILNVVFSGVFDNRLFAITITGPTEDADGVIQIAHSIEQSLRIR